VLKAVSQEPREKWKLSAWVAIFVIVPLGAGWIAGHGALHGVFQKVTGNSASGHVAAENAPGAVGNSLDISEIEVVDLNNQRWMIPMHGPLGPLTSRRFESAAPPRTQENSMNFRVWTLSPPVHSQSSTAEIKSTPPILTSSSNGPENVLPSGGTTSPGEGILVPPPPTANPSESGLQTGELIRKVEPVYPPSAIDQKLEGTVRLFAVIDENGNIKSLQPLSGPRLLFPAALDAVRQWRYSPTLLDGRPIQTERQVTVVFQLAKTQ
jgi:TonB family protein